MIKFKFKEGTEGFECGREFRNAVLAKEMGFEDGHDEKDDTAIHIVGIENEKVICYGRMYSAGDYVYAVDKICVDKKDRKQYVGDTVLRAFEDRAVTNMAGIIIADVPECAAEFFIHEDYFKTGEEYTKNSIKYYKMKKDLTKVRGCRGGCHK